MSRHRPHRRRAFTLLEVLAAFTLIAIALPAIMQGISICLRTTSVAKRQMEASTLASGKLAELVAFPGWESQALSGDFSPEHPEFRWQASALQWDTYLKEIAVIVTWGDEAEVASGIARSFALSTLVYRVDA